MDHGGDLTEARARHGGAAADWLDLSTGINPHAWPIPPSLPGAFWRRLPSQGDLDDLLDAAREAYGLPDGAAVVAAPGTQALIQWLPRLATPGERVAVLGPTYAEHARAWRAGGWTVIEAARADAVPAGIRHLVLVNPNNPDGRVIDRAALIGLARRTAEAGGWLVVDESFADPDPAISLAGGIGDADAPPGLVVLRSFGKFYGLAGLRLGFAVAAPALAEPLRAALGPWAVAGPALAIGARALRDRAWADAMRLRLMREAGALDRVLAEGGLRIVGGTPLFRLVRHPDASRLHARLAVRRIWVRSFAWDSGLLRFGLPPDDAARRRLAEALAECSAGPLAESLAASPADAHGTVDQGTRTASPATSAR